SAPGRFAGSVVPRVTARTPSRAASGATSAMKSAELRLPRASRAAANPMIRTATTTSPHQFRSARIVGAGGGVMSGTAVTDLVPRRSAIPSRTRTLTIRSPGWSAIRSSSPGWAGSGDCAAEAPPGRPGHALAFAAAPDAVAYLLAGDHGVRPFDDHGRGRARAVGPSRLLGAMAVPVRAARRVGACGHHELAAGQLLGHPDL